MGDFSSARRAVRDLPRLVGRIPEFAGVAGLGRADLAVFRYAAEHPIGSVRIWIDGIGFSLVFGWVTALVLGVVYNRFAAR